MSANSIDKLYDKEFKQICFNICRDWSIHKDLHSEAILVVLEKKYDLTQILSLKFFFAKIVWLTWRSNKFQKNYFLKEKQKNSSIIPLDLIDDIENLPEEKERNDTEAVNTFIYADPKNEMEYYEKNLFRLYLEHGNCIKLHEATKIPYRTVANDIKAIKRKLKEIHCEENTD